MVCSDKTGGFKSTLRTYWHLHSDQALITNAHLCCGQCFFASNDVKHIQFDNYLQEHNIKHQIAYNLSCSLS